MIELAHRGGIAIVRLVHGKANALDLELCEAIAAQFDALRDSAAKAAVLIRQGRMFSAGVDLLRLSDGGADYVRRFLPALHRLYDAAFFFPKPMVGVPFPALAFEVMRFATPPAFFAETILSGATYPPEVALARRMVDELAEPSELLDRAVAAAETLAALSPRAFAQTKRQLRQPAADTLERHGRWFDEEAMAVWSAPETLARVRDYVARTLKKA